MGMNELNVPLKAFFHSRRTRSGSSGALRVGIRLPQPSHHHIRINPNRPADHNKLRRVESPLAQLELRHERLPLTQPLPQLGLRQPGFLPRSHEQLDHAAVEVGLE